MKHILLSVVRSFQCFLQRVIGIPYTLNRIEGDIYKLKDSNDAIFYYLNNYLLKAEDLPPTSDPELRIMQLCDVQLLKIVDKILTRDNLTYWLDYGTLLGAVRHNGFIPWDDDMDISVPEDEYYTILSTLQREFSKYPGFECSEAEGYPMARIGLGYKHKATGIWLDIFPANVIPYTGDKEEAISRVKVAVERYKFFYSRHRQTCSIDQLKAKKKEYLPHFEKQDKKLYILPPEFGLNRPVYYEQEDLYPLGCIKFEGYSFRCPNNWQLILNQNYNSKYMELAKGGILHHGNGRIPLSQWGKASGTDMSEILNQLKSIYDNI